MIQPSSQAVTFQAVTKKYAGATVIDGLSFSVPRGSTFGLLGPNGAGKSTSLKALMGLLRIDSGRIEIFGNDVSALQATPDYVALRQRVGYVSEVHTVYKWMKVKQAMTFVKAFQPHWNDDLAAELLTLFQLEPNKKIRQLSKGMLAKLSLLLAVAHEPELLILDEPTSGLDAIAREEFLYGVLKTIADTERTIIFSSHSIGDVERIADRVGVIKSGRMVVEQSVEGLLSGTKRLRVALPDGHRLGWVPENTIWQQVHRREWELTVSEFTPQIVDQLKQTNGVEIVDVRDLSLEEIFKDYFRDSHIPAPHSGHVSEVANA
jgi:ABC-2 type transport system ATP-binding protein